MTAELRLDGATVRLDDEALDLLAAKIAPLVADRLPPVPEPWIDSTAAAEHLATSVERVHQLVHQRRIRHRKDGRKLLFRRSDLDAYLTRGDG